jgi:hypothetical protein
MSKQTAVQWLEKCFASHWNYEEHAKWDGVIHQAKQMEKKQIEDAFNEGENFSKLYFLQPYNTPECKVYYQQTYGGDHE